MILTAEDTRHEEDHAALIAACEPGVALCTIVGIEGSFSRRLGAQLAIRPDGSVVGSLADGCLERQLANDARKIEGPKVVRYGAGSQMIDFRLPCGGGLDILLDPAPGRTQARKAAELLKRREAAKLVLPEPSPLKCRAYIPRLLVKVFGEGPELDAFVRLGNAAGVAVKPFTKDRLTLGQSSGEGAGDRWTAILLLFHDHEWELPLLAEALEGDAFYIGAQGGENARHNRTLALLQAGCDEKELARIVSPIGLLPGCKSPANLAMSALTEIVGRYETLRERTV